jgi:DNA invertase Pin-like site-specific DNA recombinase
MMIGILGSLAEYERELTIERTALKRAASRPNGTKFGRPRKVANAEHVATAKRMKADGHSARDIAKYLGVSRATRYRYLAGEAAYPRTGTDRQLATANASPTPSRG